MRVGIASVAALGLTALGAPGVAAAQDRPCGFSTGFDGSYWNHCTTDGSNVLIQATYYDAAYRAGGNRLVCAPPGVTNLNKAVGGLGFWVYLASYTGQTCDDPVQFAG